MRIAIDVDDVLNDLMGEVLRLFNAQCGKQYKLDDFTAYDLDRCIDRQDANQLKKYFNLPMIWDNLEPIDGAVESVCMLVTEGHDVYLVTNHQPDSYGMKFEWIRRHFPFVKPENIACMAAKGILNVDVMIEDKLETLLSGGCYERVLRNKPWNQYDKDYIRGVYRCDDWNQIMAAIEEIKKKESEGY